MKLLTLVLALGLLAPSIAMAQDTTTSRVLATNKTSSMQKEMQEAAAAGFRYAAVMGGETSFGGKEVVVLMQKTAVAHPFEYRLLATSRTSTLQKELQELGDQGYEALGMTVGQTAMGGAELVVITRRRAR